MVNGITYNGFATPYATGGMNFGSPYSGGFNSAFEFGFNGVNGFQTTSTSSSSSSYQSEIERIRREEEEAQRRASAERQAAQERELMEEMRIEGSDIFPELTAEEEEILLAYLEKVSSSKGTTFKENAISTALPAAGAVGLTATISTANTLTTGVANLAIKASGSANSTVAKAAEVTFNGAAKTSSALTSTARVVGKWAGPVLEAGMVVYEDWNDIKYTYEYGSTSDKVKQTAQTVGVAAAAAGGFAAGAAIGTAIFPGVGSAVGAVIGAVCGTIGACLTKWGARKLCGENVGAKLRREQMAKEAQEKAAAEQAEKMESYNLMLMDALTYAQTDEELDEATAAVLAKLQGRFAQQAPPPEQSAQAAA
jgi:hypothetical protein